MGNQSAPAKPTLVLRTQCKELVQSQDVLNVLESDFIERSISTKSMSYEDKQFLDLVSCKVTVDASGRYVLPLPTRDVSKLFDNGKEVRKRFDSLCNRLRRNTELLEEYKRFMADMLDNNYAEPVSEENVY